jgi:hypothetical protein
MKRVGNLIVLLACTLVLWGYLMAAGESWFDMPNCDFCKHLLTDPGLLPNSTWEHHNISNGLITITTVPDEYMDSYNKAMAAMELTGKMLEKGEPVKMCNMCKAYGELLASGAKMEHIRTVHGDVTLLTGDTPELVAKIQAWGQRNNDEMKKMMEMEKEKEIKKE